MASVKNQCTRVHKGDAPWELLEMEDCAGLGIEGWDSNGECWNQKHLRDTANYEWESDISCHPFLEMRKHRSNKMNFYTTSE